MNQYFADLHIHVGINEQGKWVKIPTSRQLTVRNILVEALERKGMQILGIVDAISPFVIEDLKILEREGQMELLTGGGYRYKHAVTLLLGAEIETSEPDGGLAHTLVFLPDIQTMERFSQRMMKHIKNITISSQNAHMSLSRLISIASEYEAMIIPAHIFTPHKSLYGSCTNRISRLVSEKERAHITAVELGLSADTFMADRISELNDLSYLTNSDAHSLNKIAREYNIVNMDEPSYQEVFYALKRKNGRGIAANYGLNPRLGKYHRTCCAKCGDMLSDNVAICPACGGYKKVRGVFDRIEQVADYTLPIHPEHRPPYYYQIPLEFIPGIGGKTLSKLLQRFRTEMNVIHRASEEDLTEMVGEKLAKQIIDARIGKSGIVDGGGGIYGRITKM